MTVPVLVPIAVADDLPRLLCALAGRLDGDHTARGRLVTFTDGATFPALLAMKIVLADLEHAVDLAEYQNCQLPAPYWDSLLEELRSLERQLASDAEPRPR